MPGFLASAFAAALLTAPVMATAQARMPEGAAPGYGTGRYGPPTGMTGHFRGWHSREGSGAGANNFVGNGRGNPRQYQQSRGHFGGWFANNHSGMRR